MRSGIKAAGAGLSVFLAAWVSLRFVLPLTFPFLLGTALALLAEPVVNLLCGRLHLPRPAAAPIGVGVVFVCVMILLLLVGAVVLRELGELSAVLPDLAGTSRKGLSLVYNWAAGVAARLPDSLQPAVYRQIDGALSGGTALVDKAFRYLLNFAGSALSQVPDSALSLGTGVISSFMISAKLPRIRKWLRRYLSRERLRPVIRTACRLKNAVGGWLMAQLKLTGVALGILSAGLLLLRIPNALAWALGITVLDALPVLGTGTVLLPWSFLCFLQGDTPRALGLLGIYGTISLTRSVLEPKLLGKELGMDPLVALMALYAGYKLWGIGGMILSPLLAVTAVQLLPDKRRGQGEGEK